MRTLCQYNIDNMLLLGTFIEKERKKRKLKVVDMMRALKISRDTYLRRISKDDVNGFTEKELLIMADLFEMRIVFIHCDLLSGD